MGLLDFKNTLQQVKDGLLEKSKTDLFKYSSPTNNFEQLTLEENNSLKVRFNEKIFNDFFSLFEDNINRITSSEELIVFLRDNSKDIFIKCSEYTKISKPKFYNTQLYWIRLKIRVLLKTSKNKILKDDYTLINQCINIVEQYSRNLVQDLESEDLGTTNIIITGFDPFNMGGDITQVPMDNNPSGELSLYLHNRSSSNIRFFTAIFPVRWEDFDNSILETFLNQFSFQADAVFTVSLTPQNGINIDKYAGNVRGGSRDNNFQSRSGSIINYPNSFLETSLPFSNVINKKIGKYQVFLDNTAQIKGTAEKQIENIAEIEDKIPVKGSGGSYLSNEIFYRTCKWRKDTQPLSFVPNIKKVVNGHLHIQGLDKEEYDQDIPNYVETIAQLIDLIVAEL